MAGDTTFSKDFPIDASIFTSAKVSLSASTDTNADLAIGLNKPFPDGDIQVGHISVTADTGNVSLKSTAIPGGASLSFDISASGQSGLGIYGKSADAIAALKLTDPPSLKIADVTGERYLLMDFGYSASVSASGTQPIGVLGSATFGVDAKGDSTFALLHRFDATRGANDIMVESFASWRLPRHVALVGADLNIKPQTWLLFELDGSLSLKLAATLGWNMNFARELTVLGVTHDLSAKIDAGLTANFGFNVSGKYILIVARESDDPKATSVRLTLSRQSSKGLNFGLNLSVGIQGADPQLPTNFNDFIQATFGDHGLQVLNDLSQWADPTNDLGQKIAGLIGNTVPTALEDKLLQATGIDPVLIATDFAKAKQIVADALNQWTALPSKLSSMLWTFLGQESSPAVVADFKTFLTALASPATGATALATVLQNAIFGDTPEGQFLESIADQGLLSVIDQLPQVGTTATQVLNILNGGLIQKLQTFINQQLDLDQIRNAAADFSNVGQWLQNRLGNFLDKTLNLADLKDIQTAITTLDKNVASYYTKAVTALTNKYSIDFAATYQRTTTDTALIDVTFDMSKPSAAALFNEVAAQSKLDDLLTKDTVGVTLTGATLTHEISRKGTVDLNMPLFDFSTTHVNDAMVTLTAENLSSALLLYQVSGKDTITVANRSASQLSVLASLKVTKGKPPQLDADGSIAYEMRQVQARMRPRDLESRTQPFINTYLNGLFSTGDSSLTSFYADLDIALTAATHSQSNFLGDVALSMQLNLPASALSGWFEPRDKSTLFHDQMNISRALQTAWRRVLPALYFQNLNNYHFEAPQAALLVWSSMPVAAGVTLNGSTLTINTGKGIFWDDIFNPDMRRGVARAPSTAVALSARLAAIQAQLVESGNSNAGFFDRRKTTQFIDTAVGDDGDPRLLSLLITESQMIDGATGALKKIAEGLSTAATAPTEAIKLMAGFVAQLTDTFNKEISSVYSGVSGRVVGPMLLVEASAALGSPGVPPSALMSLYALNPGHTFKLSDFVTGTNPPKADVALPQTLVSLT